jgi:hypothetical protein
MVTPDGGFYEPIVGEILGQSRVLAVDRSRSPQRLL